MIVGIDIGQESAQICYYDEQQRQPVSVSVVNSADSRQKYQFGFMLSGANQDNLKELLCTLLALLPKNGRKAGERDNICVTVSDFSKPVLEKLSAAVQLTGYAKENWSFISHEEAYAYYAFSQKKELYVNGAVLLDYREDGLHTHYMTIVKKGGQEMIPEESHLYTSETICAVPQRQKTLAQAEKELIQCVQEAFKDKIVSAVYLTGTGFEAEKLPKELTHVLCARRKAFAGQNLFVKGAAYAALKEDASDGHGGRLLACRNRITTGLELSIKERGEEKRFRMVRPGTNWYEAGRSVELILEDMRTIPVILHQCDTGYEWTQEIDISAIPFRQGRLTRVVFEVCFDSDSHCIVRIEDLGFGGFVKNSGVVVEEEINLESDKSSTAGSSSGITMPAGSILCRTARAQKPLVLEEPGVQIYSLEELCYYIYNNIYILTNAFLDEKLIAFIREDIKEPLLADKLEQLKRENAGLAEEVVTILKYVDYYDTAEIEQVKDLLNMLDTQNVYERMKMRADRFLEKGCYYSAISNYDKIVNGERDINLSGLFYAKVYHNLGTAYARMFFFDKAAQYFEEAYKIGQHEKFRKCYLAACRMAKGEEQVQDMQAPEEEQILQRELEQLTDNARYSDEYRALQEIDHLKSDGEVAQYYKAIDDCMDRWKAQYERYTS